MQDPTSILGSGRGTCRDLFACTLKSKGTIDASFCGYVQ